MKQPCPRDAEQENGLRSHRNSATGGHCTSVNVLCYLQMPEQALQGNYLTLSQAAEFVGVSVATVRRWIASGQLPAAKAGTAVNSKIVVSRADLEEFLWAASPETTNEGRKSTTYVTES
jgi:excisionase family DNA binding protein